jgi:metal-responsive CopG/Arc/MetJ family transcriptional regulator
MKTIRVVLDEESWVAMDRAARATGRSRSALVRDALREHLRQLKIDSLEERDRQGCAARPPAAAEPAVWEAVAAWPEE